MTSVKWILILSLAVLPGCCQQLCRAMTTQANATQTLTATMRLHLNSVTCAPDDAACEQAKQAVAGKLQDANRAATTLADAAK